MKQEIYEMKIEIKREIVSEFLKNIHRQCCNYADEDWSYCDRECPVEMRMFCHIHAVAPYKWKHKQIEQAVNQMLK